MERNWVFPQLQSLEREDGRSPASRKPGKQTAFTLSAVLASPQRDIHSAAPVIGPTTVVRASTRRRQGGGKMEPWAACDRTFSKALLMTLEQRTAPSQLSLVQAQTNSRRMYPKHGCTSEAWGSSARPSPSVLPAILHQSRFPLVLLLYFPLNQSMPPFH